MADKSQNTNSFWHATQCRSDNTHLLCDQRQKQLPSVLQEQSYLQRMLLDQRRFEQQYVALGQKKGNVNSRSTYEQQTMENHRSEAATSDNTSHDMDSFDAFCISDYAEDHTLAIDLSHCCQMVSSITYKDAFSSSSGSEEEVEEVDSLRSEFIEDHEEVIVNKDACNEIESRPQFNSNVESSYHEIEDNGEAKYAPTSYSNDASGSSEAAAAIKWQAFSSNGNPPKVQILRKRFVAARLSYPNSSASNSSSCASGFQGAIGTQKTTPASKVELHTERRNREPPPPPAPPQSGIMSTFKSPREDIVIPLFSRKVPLLHPISCSAPCRGDTLSPLYCAVEAEQASFNAERAFLLSSEMAIKNNRLRHLPSFSSQQLKQQRHQYNANHVIRPGPGALPLRPTTDCLARSDAASHSAPNTPQSVGCGVRGGNPPYAKILDSEESSIFSIPPTRPLNSSMQLLLSISSLLRSQAAMEALNATDPKYPHDERGFGALTNVLPVYTCIRGRPCLVQLYSASTLDTKFNAQESIDADSSDSEVNSVNLVPEENNHIMTESAVTASSGNSLDYYSPPAEDGSVSAVSTCAIDQIQVQQISMCTSMTPGLESHLEVRVHNTTYLVPDRKVLKSGVVSKLSSKFKIWRSYWCILTQRNFLFYHHQQQECQSISKPRRCIALEDIVEVTAVQNQLQVDGMVNAAFLFRVGGTKQIEDNKTKLHPQFQQTTVTCTSETERTMWIAALRRARRRLQALSLALKQTSHTLHSGWLRRVRNACSRRLWCVLTATHIFYYRQPPVECGMDFCSSINQPTGFRELAGTLCQRLRSAASDSDSDTGETPFAQRTFSLTKVESGGQPVYFVAPSGLELSRWMHYLGFLLHSSKQSENSNATNDCVLSSVISETHKSTFYHTTGSIATPVSSTTSPDLVGMASQLFSILLKTCYTSNSGNELHSNEPLGNDGSKEQCTVSSPTSNRNSSAVHDFYMATRQRRIETLQHMAKMCYSIPGLKDELFLQILKQTIAPPKTSKERRFPRILSRSTAAVSLFCSSTSTQPSTSVQSVRFMKELIQLCIPGSEVPLPMLIAWHALCLMLPLFLPTPPVIAFLEQWFENHGDVYTEVGKYALFCKEALRRVQKMGERQEPPAWLEALAVNLRHPYSHSRPFSLPIHQLSGEYQIVSFDSSSKVAELLESAVKLANVKETAMLQFGLFLWHRDATLCDSNRTMQAEFVYLNPDWKVCDVISRAETLALAARPEVKPENVNIILCLRARLVFPKHLRQLEIKELQIICNQLHRDVNSGRYPIEGPLLLTLAALLSQASLQDYRLISCKDVTLSRQVVQLFPSFITNEEDKIMHLKLMLLEQWSCLAGRAPLDCLREYCTLLEKCSCFTARFFSCACPDFEFTAGQPLQFAIRFDLLVIFDSAKCRVLEQISLSNIVSFGARNSTVLFVVFNGPDASVSLTKLHFRLLSTAAMLEAVQLLYDYLNISARKNPSVS